MALQEAIKDESGSLRGTMKRALALERQRLVPKPPYVRVNLISKPARGRRPTQNAATLYVLPVSKQGHSDGLAGTGAFHDPA